MAREPKRRESYLADANFLTRLGRAVEMDNVHDLAWKKDALRHISALIALFSSDASSRAELAYDKEQ